MPGQGSRRAPRRPRAPVDPLRGRAGRAGDRREGATPNGPRRSASRSIIAARPGSATRREVEATVVFGEAPRRAADRRAVRARRRPSRPVHARTRCTPSNGSSTARRSRRWSGSADRRDGRDRGDAPRPPAARALRDPAAPRPLTDPIVLDAFTHLLGSGASTGWPRGDVIFPLRLGRLTIFGDDPPEGSDVPCRISDQGRRAAPGSRSTPRSSARRPGLDAADRLGRLAVLLAAPVSRRLPPARPHVSSASRWIWPDASDAVAVWLEPPADMGRPVWRDVLEQIQLAPEERAGCLKPTGHDGRRTLRLWGRIAAKEAARRLWLADGGAAGLPGRPRDRARREGTAGASLATASPSEPTCPPSRSRTPTGVAVALAARDPAARVGIDVEPVVDRAASFEAMAFSARRTGACSIGLAHASGPSGSRGSGRPRRPWPRRPGWPSSRARRASRSSRPMRRGGSPSCSAASWRRTVPTGRAAPRPDRSTRRIRLGLDARRGASRPLLLVTEWRRGGLKTSIPALPSRRPIHDHPRTSPRSWPTSPRPRRLPRPRLLRADRRRRPGSSPTSASRRSTPSSWARRCRSTTAGRCRSAS